MDERKFDVKSIIGFALIFVLLMWFMNNNKPSQEELAKHKAQQEQQANKTAANTQNNTSTVQPTDLGNFAYSTTLPQLKMR